MVSVFWFRRDLRLTDNVGLHQALKSGHKVLPIFIFDQNILDELPKNDARISFIYENLLKINNDLKKKGSGLIILHGKPVDEFKKLTFKYEIAEVFYNNDYEPYAIQRDQAVAEFCKTKGIQVRSFKDQVIFEKEEILKSDGKPYTIYTPYKNKWLAEFNNIVNESVVTQFDSFLKYNSIFPKLSDLGFEESLQKVKSFSLDNLYLYTERRDFPADDITSYLSPHLRFGTVSIRKILSKLKKDDSVFQSELIWREFFSQILYHFPKVVDQNFKAKYDGIDWRNNKEEFDLWCKGQTGYPIVDAGMRQLNKSGYMHNRVRMITASFLIKHLIIDWRWGETYFAKKLLDYDLASNNGNWQWVAGTGCDAAPYFRIFNPIEQLKKFDSDFVYVKKWIPELESDDYPKPIVEHKYARKRALDFYKKGILA